jgi:hypothetical protein
MIVSLHQSAGAALGREPAADRATPARIRIDYATWRARIAGHASPPHPAPPTPDQASEPCTDPSPAAFSQSRRRAA